MNVNTRPWPPRRQTVRRPTHPDFLVKQEKPQPKYPSPESTGLKPIVEKVFETKSVQASIKFWGFAGTLLAEGAYRSEAALKGKKIERDPMTASRMLGTYTGSEVGALLGFLPGIIEVLCRKAIEGARNLVK